MTTFFSIFILTFAYLIGSIPTGLIIGKVFYQKNLHNEGSGATGTTNSMRVLGKKAALFVFLFDIIKALIPTAITLFFQLPVNITIIAFATILGHCFPVFANFKGGKAVATSFGFFVVFFPWPTTLGFLVFTTSFILFDMISLSSILASTAIMLMTVIFSHESFITKMFIFFIWSILIYRHKDNIKRMIQKKENKMTVSLKHKLILTAITSIIVIISSLLTLSTPKDDAVLKKLFTSEIQHLTEQKQNYQTVAQTNPTPNAYYDLYKSNILLDAYNLITYDINSTYTPTLQNDISEKLVVEYNFSSRINLNAHEADEIFTKYNTRFQTLLDETQKKELLEEMYTYLVQKYPATRTQGAPLNRISLQYAKINNEWILPANAQIELSNYLNSDIFVNNFATSYLGSDENALSQTITQTIPVQTMPDINTNTSLQVFASDYITYMKNESFIELPYNTDSSKKTESNIGQTMLVTYSFNTQSIIPVKEIQAFIAQKQAEIDKLPEDQKSDNMKLAKQALIQKFQKKETVKLPDSKQLTLSFYKGDHPADPWKLSPDDFNRFQTFVTTQLIIESK